MDKETKDKIDDLLEFVVKLEPIEHLTAATAILLSCLERVQTFAFLANRLQQASLVFKLNEILKLIEEACSKAVDMNPDEFHSYLHNSLNAIYGTVVESLQDKYLGGKDE